MKSPLRTALHSSAVGLHNSEWFLLVPTGRADALAIGVIADALGFVGERTRNSSVE